MSRRHTSRLLLLACPCLAAACGSSESYSPLDAGTESGRRELDATTDAREARPDAHGDAADAADAAPVAAVSILAGKRGGQGNLDGVATAARTYLPSFLADDGEGHVFFTDRNGVRSLDVATGAVTTLAGAVLSPPFAKVADSSCNFIAAEAVDGPGTAARFNGALGIASDGAGNLYVADSCNSTLRKIHVATQEVTTYAGTAGTPGSTDVPKASALFSLPAGVAYDGAGNLYVSDDADVKFARKIGGDTIRKVELATGKVSTLAGTPGVNGSKDETGGKAMFDGPAGLAYVKGFLYVADTNNATIRRVDVTTGAVKTVAGTAGNVAFANGIGDKAAFNTPIGLVYDGAGSLYVTDSGNSALRKIALSDFTVTTVAGKPGTAGDADGVGSAARFAVPFGLAYDGAGALYLADETYEASPFVPPVGGDTLRKFDTATATVSTVAGAPPVFGSADGTADQARFDIQFGGLAYDGSGIVYVADTGNAVVRKVDVATGAVSTLAGAVGEAGHRDGSSHAARFVFPSFLAYDGKGKLYVSDGHCNDASPQVCAPNPTLREVDTATGAVSTLVTLPWGTTEGFSNPLGLAYDGAGHLFVADNLAVVILRVDVSTGKFATLAGSGQVGTKNGTGTAASFEFPYGLAYDGDGALFVTDWDASTVRRIVVASGEVTTFAGTPFATGSRDGVGEAGRFNQPQGISYDGAGHLYVTDAALLGAWPLGGATLRRIDISTARVTTVTGSPGIQGVLVGPLSSARFNDPAGVVATGPQELLISDIGENVLLRVALTP